MSTSFKGLNPLFSSVRVEQSPKHARITMWNKGANIGTVCVNLEDTTEFLRLLFTEDEIAHRVSLGEGKVGLTKGENLPANTQLLSEYGELTTRGQIT